MPIRFACAKCGKRYKVADDRAGRRVRCKVCKAKIEVAELPPGVEEVRVNESGTPSLIHAPREQEFTPATGDSDAIGAISDHIEAHIGPIETVFHEIVSDLVHVDIHQIAPGEGRPYWTLVTSGMSDLPMTVPEGAEVSRYAEMVLSLPPDWPMTQEAWSDERHYWPIRWLKILARLPHEYRTFLGFGHTVPNGDPPEPFAEGTDLCCMLLLPPILPPEGFRELKVDDAKTIEFFAAVPLYREEMAYKLKRGSEPLLDRLAKVEVTELLDLDRPNSCKRRFWPL